MESGEVNGEWRREKGEGLTGVGFTSIIRFFL